MKCHCGYEGIPTAHHDAANPHWKCPKCNAPRKDAHRHDPMLDVDEHDYVCSQCGMRGPTPQDLHTPCPGHGAHWHMRTLNCKCGEWHMPPTGKPRKISCRRCGTRFPDYLPDLGD